MNYSNMLVIPNGLSDTLFGVLAIITLAVLIYTFGFSELMKKKISKLKEAKRTAVDGLMLQKIRAEAAQEEDDYEEAQ
ncbi:hypothetical protein [Butyrivibrio sp. AC2005]|uniref:hypothetical protein n=1 Tax=Butyrivibrio sp. AC2005 TaxID=1280672 RepID=UPI00040681F5|nr:hypothetical protein [Butyrivibrio sp. AC2005]